MKLPRLSGKEKASVFFVIMVLLGLGIQLINPKLNSPPVTGKLTAPKEIAQIYERACYDCHSNETQLAWYDKIAPISWKVFADVREARSRFNFSEWNKLSSKEQQSILWETVNAVLAKKMPLPSYLAAHPRARISVAELEVLKRYVKSLHYNKPVDSDLTNHSHTRASSDSTPVALNGVKYVVGYRNWQVISSTNRFDNYTMRIVYGNEIAVKAIRENKINPFPNGATIVKIVWNKMADKDGNVRTGTFSAEQVMTKDEQRYPKTGGWGFAIFNGQRLLPAGKTPMFDVQCFNCHKLMASDNGDVFNIPLKNEDMEQKAAP